MRVQERVIRGVVALGSVFQAVVEIEISWKEQLDGGDRSCQALVIASGEGS